MKTPGEKDKAFLVGRSTTMAISRSGQSGSSQQAGIGDLLAGRAFHIFKGHTNGQVGLRSFAEVPGGERSAEEVKVLCGILDAGTVLMPELISGDTRCS